MGALGGPTTQHSGGPRPPCRGRDRHERPRPRCSRQPKCCHLCRRIGLALLAGGLGRRCRPGVDRFAARSSPNFQPARQKSPNAQTRLAAIPIAEGRNQWSNISAAPPRDPAASAGGPVGSPRDGSSEPLPAASTNSNRASARQSGTLGGSLCRSLPPQDGRGHKGQIAPMRDRRRNRAARNRAS